MVRFSRGRGTTAADIAQNVTAVDRGVGTLRRSRPSLRRLRSRNLKLSAESARGALLDFAMSRQGCDLSVGRISPEGVPTTFTDEMTAVRPEVSLDVEPFHDATNRCDSRTAEADARLRASSR